MVKLDSDVVILQKSLCRILMVELRVLDLDHWKKSKI